MFVFVFFVVVVVVVFVHIVCFFVCLFVWVFFFLCVCVCVCVCVFSLRVASSGTELNTFMSEFFPLIVCRFASIFKIYHCHNIYNGTTRKCHFLTIATFLEQLLS